MGAGSCVCEMQGREQVWVKILKPSRYGSVLGAPGGTATGDVVWGCGGGVYEVVVVAGLWVCKMQATEQVGQKNQNQASVARFRTAV